MYHQGDLSYFEAVNKETLKNSYTRFEEDQILHFVKSKDPKIPPRLQLDVSWRPQRDPVTGVIRAEGKLWNFIEAIASSRREGKNRRDGATISTRVVSLANKLGTRLFEEVVDGNGTKVPIRLSDEDTEIWKSNMQAKKGRRRMEKKKANL